MRPVDVIQYHFAIRMENMARFLRGGCIYIYVYARQWPETLVVATV